MSYRTPNPARPSMNYPGYLVLIFALLTLGGCGNTSPAVIHVVLPNDYVGAFEIRADSQAGDTVQRIDGVIRYLIPVSGSLRVRTVIGFGEWHTLQASYVDGRIIPVSTHPPLTGPQIVLAEIGGASDNSYLFFVGMPSMVQEAYNDPGKLHLGNRNED